jgi:hypothetical protein
MFCGPVGEQRFTAHGELRLIGAHIGGQLVLSGAELDNKSGATLRGVDDKRGAALNGALLQVEHGVLCDAWGEQRFTAHGELRLAGAHIGGPLKLNGATLSNTAGSALDLESARVDGELFMRFAKPPAGVIDLTAARLGRVHDSEVTWPSRLRLRGCTYSSVSADEDANTGPGREQPLARLWRRVRPGAADVQQRLRWIRVAEDGGPSAAEGDGYAPQPYAQLIAHYRREGRDNDARRVGFERERRRRGQLHLPGQAWNVFLRWTVGYGYKPVRALVLLACWCSSAR